MHTSNTDQSDQTIEDILEAWFQRFAKDEPDGTKTLVLHETYGWEADEALRKIEALIQTSNKEAQLQLVNELIATTRQTWDSRSPFANIENINSNTLASTANSLLVQKAHLEEQLKQEEAK